jgi:hypothetical protein
MEDAAEAIYGRKATSVRQLYVVAEEVRARLHQFAQDCGIASAHPGTGQESLELHESMTLHNRMWTGDISLVKELTILAVYYHAIILVFRPFLVANQAMRVSGGTGEIKDMWLRQACRHAVDAAQDSIEFSVNMSQICTVVESFNPDHITTSKTVFYRLPVIRRSLSNAVVPFYSTTSSASLPSIRTTWNTFKRPYRLYHPWWRTSR